MNPVDKPNVYTVEFDSAALRDLKKMPKEVQIQVLTVAKTLALNPRPDNVEPLTGYRGLYRVRTGNYRIIYTIEDDKLLVVVVAVGDRKEIYDIVDRRFAP